MRLGRFRLGMRTTKSALAVLLCILLFHILDRGTPLIAALSAVFSLRQDLNTSVEFGKSRILGNAIGGLCALLYFYIKTYFHNDFLVELFLLPFLVIVVIVISDGIGNNAGIIAAISTLLLISLSISEVGSVDYVIQRILDTFIGTFIAVTINFTSRPPLKEQSAEVAEDLAVLKEKEKKLTVELDELQKKIQKKER
ncbi:MAG: FUSC family protein [Enterococcus sp.]